MISASRFFVAIGIFTLLMPATAFAQAKEGFVGRLPCAHPTDRLRKGTFNLTVGRVRLANGKACLKPFSAYPGCEWDVELTRTETWGTNDNYLLVVVNANHDTREPGTRYSCMSAGRTSLCPSPRTTISTARRWRWGASRISRWLLPITGANQHLSVERSAEVLRARRVEGHGERESRLSCLSSCCTQRPALLPRAQNVFRVESPMESQHEQCSFRRVHDPRGRSLRRHAEQD